MRLLSSRKKEIPPYMKDGIGGKIFNAFNVFFMVVLMFVFVYPIWNVLVLALNEGTDAMRGGLFFFPRRPTLENFQYILGRRFLLQGAFMSLLRVVVGTGTHILCTSLLAYVISVRDFSGRRIVRAVFLASMYFSGGMIPTYLLISNLGLLNTFTVYWLPAEASTMPGLISVWSLLFISSYIMGLPEALIESARIDGAGDFRIYLSIILPLCVPVIAAIGIMTAVRHWNSWFDVLIYNPGGQWDTLVVFLRRILLHAEEANRLAREGLGGREVMDNITIQSMRAATTIVVTLPIIFIYPFFQKYFMSGITLGAVKG